MRNGIYCNLAIFCHLGVHITTWNLSFADTKKKPVHLCILSLTRTSGRPLWLKLGAQSMHGLMKTFDNDVDVINDDSSVSSRHNPWHCISNLWRFVEERREIPLCSWVINILFAVCHPGSILETLFLSMCFCIYLVSTFSASWWGT